MQSWLFLTSCQVGVLDKGVRTCRQLCCQTVADIIKGKTPEEIRAYFHIKNDFTPEEEEEVRRENQWAFE